MSLHEEYLELCAVATAGELDTQEKKHLEEHLRVCATCRKAFWDYEKVLQHALPQLASETEFDREEASGTWSVYESKRAFFQRLDDQQELFGFKKRDPDHSATANLGKRFTYLPSQIRWLEIGTSSLACIALGLALGMVAYRTGSKRATELARETSKASSILLEEETSHAPHERAQVILRLAEEDRLILSLKRQLSDELKKIEAQKLVPETRGSSSPKTGQTNPAGEAAGAAEAMLAAQLKVHELQRAIDVFAVEREGMFSRAATLEAKVGELTQLVRDREHSLDEKQAELINQQELLDHDRDIRELMGARDLYIAEVHDVAWTGKTDKTYGRVFYTKGKSLIFYAYDLNAQPGPRNAASFQAWGQRGPDKKQARNLGIFYEDNANKKRWVLKAEDPKALEDIDAVFVTVEPNGGSHRPTGKQLLFAYLQVNPNHP